MVSSPRSRHNTAHLSLVSFLEQFSIFIFSPSEALPSIIKLMVIYLLLYEFSWQLRTLVGPSHALVEYF